MLAYLDQRVPRATSGFTTIIYGSMPPSFSAMCLKGAENLQGQLHHLEENTNGSVSCLVRTSRWNPRPSGFFVRHISIDIVRRGICRTASEVELIEIVD